ncbi:hypothetical protein Tco_0754607 [Tanacetum coccineum]
MSSITAQQTKLDLELVPKENRLDIRKCNGRIPRGLTPREPTFQVVLDAIALTPCYPAFLITADVPEVYMHQFWNSVYKHDNFYKFKLDKKKRFKLTLEVFRDIFQICPIVLGRDFDALPSEEDTMYFLRELGYTGEINSLNDTSGLDKLRLSRAQILWGMFYQKNIDYVELLWEDFIYQIENRVYKKQEKMYYLASLKFVSARESTQIYRAVLPECLTSPYMKESKSYMTYLGYATGVVPPKMAQNFKKASPSKKDSDRVPVDEEPVQKGKRVKRPTKKSTTKPTAGVVIKEALMKTKSKSKEKEKVDVTRGKGIELLSEVALTEEAQTKEVRKKILSYFHKTHPSGSGMVAKKPQSVDKITPTVISEGTGDKPGDLDVTEDDSTKSESKSYGNDEDDNNNEQESKQEEESEDDDQEEEEFVHTPTDDKDDDNLESEKPTQTDKEVVQGEGVDAKTEVPVTSSSRSSDLASKFLNFSDIPHADAEIVSLLDVHVHHEVPRTQAPTHLTILIFVITESSPVYTHIPQSSQTFTPPPIPTTPNPPPTIETTNPLSTLSDFASVFRFNDRITALEKEVAELKKDPLHTQVTTLVDEHLDTWLGETREEFMKFISESLTTRIKEQLIKESHDEVNLAKVSSQPHSTYEAGFYTYRIWVKEDLIGKMRKHGRKDKDKDEDPFAGSDRGLKKRKTRKDAEPTTGPKNKDSTSSSSKGTKSQPKPSGKSVQSEEPVFEVADSDMPQDQEGNPGDNDDEPRKSRCLRVTWLQKLHHLKNTLIPDWQLGRSTERSNSKLVMTLAASTSTDKSLKDFDELMRTPIDFSRYILNGLKIKNLTQEILCYKALLEKLDWENPEGVILLGGVSTMTTGRLLQDKGTLSNDLPGIEDMVMRKHGYGYLEEIVVRRADNVLYRFKEGDFPQLRINDIEDMLLIVASFFARRHYQEYRHGVLAKEKMEHIGKKRASFLIKDITNAKERRMMRSLEKFVGGRIYGTDLRLLQRTI